MKKVKCITLLLIILTLMLFIPNVANAATEQTYSDTAQGIEWGYEIDNSGNIINLRCKSTDASGEITIPATIDGKKVISLKQDAFKEIIGITKVVIPEGITSIGRSAFYGCISLSEVTIPNTVVKIENYAFEDCTSLNKVILPDNLIEIPEKLFESCKNLSQVTFPANLVSIGNYAFDGCNALASITLPGKLVTIGNGAFRGCSTLQSVVIPNSVTVLGQYSFANCVSLKDITLSNKITRIENETFLNCTSMTSIKIPESVTTIGTGSYAWYSPFDGCTGLIKVLIPDSVTNIAVDVFADCSKTVTIFGNEGKTSKQYAEDNKLNFRPISEWDTFDGSSDSVAPTVKNIEIPHESVSGYYDSNSTTYIVPVNKVLIINVNFSETITATTSPTLTIKFGNGKNIELTNGVVSGSTIAYSYTITKSDVGTMAAVSLTGGNVKDDAGNAATLTCPKLKVSYFDHYVYANGTAIDVEDGNNNNNNNADDNNDNSNTPPADATNKPTDSNKPADTTTKPDTSKKDDNTTATGKLPQTGLTMGMTLAIVVVLAGGVFAYFKYSKLRGI